MEIRRLFGLFYLFGNFYCVQHKNNFVRCNLRTERRWRLRFNLVEQKVNFSTSKLRAHVGKSLSFLTFHGSFQMPNFVCIRQKFVSWLVGLSNYFWEKKVAFTYFINSLETDRSWRMRWSKNGISHRFLCLKNVTLKGFKAKKR